MKYAVTGHTQGLGRAIFDRLSPDCIGFSKSVGYDITSVADRKRIISESMDCKVFINSAFQSDGQIRLMYELFEEWKNSDKLIVNIGSDTTSGIKKHIHIYSAYKAALDKGSQQLSHLDLPCKVVNVKFGYLGTTKILENINPSKFIDLEDAVDYLMQQIEWCTKYKITDCLLRP